MGLRLCGVLDLAPASVEWGAAAAFAESLTRYPVQPITLDVLWQAFALCNRFSLSYWDAAILSAAIVAGCDAVYSEDMSAEQAYDGLRVINPFS